MGVPKFYRWISERYPKINEIISDSALLPEFDHLYLDMNGIIHGCTHPSHLDVSDVLSEKDMMLGIMHYLDRIVTQIVKPKVSLYMAIDGVAPRAKLNQQRSRRFRSAKDLAEATKELKKKGVESSDNNDKQVFDSNCITPGTEFMAKVSDIIHYFIRKKLKDDPQWKHLQVIFSGHEIPGEGEHKIMEHIRNMKNQPGYQPNTRHCIYGQDADLIMLGLVTHEPHFTILREVIDFNFDFKSKNSLKTVKKFTKESDFQLLHLSILREYLKMEFCYRNPTISLESVIDDFVFMTFLVGNDFLPHLNTLDISEGAFDLLFTVYKEQRASWGEGQYLTNLGSITDAQRLENFLAAIGTVETETLEQQEKNAAEYIKKKRKWNKRDGIAETGPTDAQLKADEDSKQADYLTMMQQIMNQPGVEFVSGWKPVQPGEKDFKGRYYYEKFKYKPTDIDKHLQLRKSYMEGLMWCLAYYYRGCISWGWFYPYHYGPMLSDLINLPQMFAEIKFELGEPLTPFQQLMGCLPPASSVLVPKPYRFLMSSPESPILRFYPVDFEVDMNGKKNPWEGVNLLPFIEVQELKDAIEKFCPASKLTPAEQKRNTRGKMYFYKHDLTCVETISSPNTKIGLTDIIKCHSSVTMLEEPVPNNVSFRPELIPGTKIPYPGFPSLNVLPIANVELIPIGVNVFGMSSKYHTMVLKLHTMPQIPPLETLADAVLEKSLFVNWPMMHEGKVIGISDAKCEIRMVKGKKKMKQYNQVEAERWITASTDMMQGYMAGTGVPGSGGVEIGEITIRLKLLPLQGMKTNLTNGSTKKVFGREEADVPLQLALWQAPAPDPRFIERGPMTLQDRFPVGASVILTKGKYRGCTGIVAGVADKKKVAVKVQIYPPDIPFGLALARSVYESYISSVDAARILKLNPGLFGKITGAMMFNPGNYDLGLNLKSGDGMCVAGYTRQRRTTNGNDNNNNKNKNSNGKDKQKKAWDAGDSLLVIGSSRTSNSKNDDDPQARIQWEYTPKAIRLVNEYRQKFPLLFQAIARQPNEKKYDATAVFGPNGAEWLPMVREWLNGIESAKLPRTPVSTEAMSVEAIAAVEKAAHVRNLAVKKKGYPKESLIKIPGSALYSEGMTGATDVMLASDHNNNEAPELGDRIVNLCASGIPFGARGTVIAIHEATSGCVEIVMDEEFIGGTNLQGSCSNFRGKLCVWAHLLKVSPENSKGLVDKLVPKGSGKAAIAKIMSNIENQTKNQKQVGEAESTAPDDKTFASGSAEVPELMPEPPIPKPISQPTSQGVTKTSRAASTGRGRAASTGRGKQGAWREARGPDEHSIGFKQKKKGDKTGLSRWKAMVAANRNRDKQQQRKQRTQQQSKAQTFALKAMLGVPTAPAPPGDPVAPPVVQQQPTPIVTTPASAASAGLKAMLGVGTTETIPAPPPQPTDPGFPPPPPPPSSSLPPVPAPTVADRLFEMMAKQQHQQPQQQMPVPMPPHPSSFNFTYVEEGKEAPAPSRPPMSQGGFPPPPPVPMPMPNNMPPYAFMPPPPPPHMQMPMPMSMPMPMHSNQMRHMPPMHMPSPPTGLTHMTPAPQNIPAPHVVSSEEFPPLGSSPPKQAKEPEKPAETTKNTNSGFMVPSSVVRKK